MVTVTAKQKQALAIATTLAIALGAYFLKHYILLIITAAIVAFTFNPIYKRLLKRWNNPGRAAMTTLLLTFIAIIIPVGIVIAITSFQVIHLVNVIDASTANTDLNSLFTNVINTINHTLQSLNIPYHITESSVRDGLTQALHAAAQSILSGIGSFVGSMGRFISTFIIYIYVFLSLLINQDKLLETFRQLNPLGKDISNLYTKRAGVMTGAMVRGQFIIATVQGVTDAFFLYLAGMHSTFFFFSVLLTVLSIIPLGGGIIVIPIGIIMILTGQLWQGALVLFGHIVIVTNEDNIMRPKLVPAEARLDPALTLLSVFSGLAFFGFIGIVLGPVIMILIVTTIQVYLEVFKNIESANKVTQPTKHLMQKLKFWKKKPATT